MEGVSFVIAPIYQWTTHEITCHLKYSVKKPCARDPYRKATKNQREQGEARRGLEAARGVLPVTGGDHEGHSVRDGNCAEAAAQQSLASLLAPMGRKVVAPGEKMRS